MMGKINLDKLNSFEPIRPERQAEVKSAEHLPVRPEKSSEPVGKDRVNVSDKAAEVGKLVGKIQDLPEVRTDKVEEVRARVESGEFDPTPAQIADAILQDESK